MESSYGKKIIALGRVKRPKVEHRGNAFPDADLF